jgi:acyl transferase domain-containing protein/acyl carrier protein
MEPYEEPQDYLGEGLGIAIIGMAARFPGANDVDTFWEHLRAGRELIRFFNDDELRAAGVSQADLDNPAYVKAAPVLEGIDLFDAPFFDCSPTEATYMDPQQRLLLEVAWEALEDAGYTGQRESDSIGVYAGIKMNTYVADFFASADQFGPEDRMQIMIGNGDFSLSTRISYKLNLKGPSYMVQTACSTSLAAVHLACQALLLDECRMALAGAVAVEIPHTVGYHYQHGGPASPDGHCRPFDAQAQGTVFGSGVGMVLLKRLADALEDGDQIYAVIRGTAVNNDGALKASFTAPSVEGQTKVIMEALACANVDADSISYVEAHGTATPLGDPIEIQALTNAFRASTDRQGFCRLGSVKGNVGHLDAAAGLAGLIKTALALKHGQIPASLHYEQPNPEIDFEHSPFAVNTVLVDWPRGSTPRRAGVSSFGFGGTNTHVILEEAPAPPPPGPSRPRQLLLLSAKTETALDAATLQLARYLREHPETDLADVAYTLKVGRPAFKHRRALVCSSADEAAAALANPRDPRLLTALQDTGDRPVAFLLSGQGAQYAGMGRELYEHEPVFREWVDRCAELLRPHLGLDLRALLFEDDQRPTTNDQQPTTEGAGVGPSSFVVGRDLEQTRYAQPALFVVEYALAQMWRAWGVVPRAMIGHSIGEYVAACLAGVFSLEDALALVADRGRLMQQMPPGAMLSVALPEAELRPLLGAQLDLAAVNGPARCVVAGPAEAVQALERELVGRDISCRRLHTSHAFHSAMMEPVLEPFLARLRRVRFSAPTVPYLSNLSGAWITAEQATSPDYWARHLRAPVRFAEGLAILAQEPALALLEVGPGQMLATLARQALAGPDQPVILTSLPDPKDSQPALAFALGALGGLWLAGVKPDWAGFYAHERRRRIALPTYPFDRRRYWFEAPKSGARPQADAPQHKSRHVAKQADLADWFYAPSWKRTRPPAPAPSEDTPQRWLLFSDERGLGALLAGRLAQAGHEVVQVRAGPAFARLDGHTFALNPARPEDYAALLREGYPASAPPEAVVHLWSVTDSPPDLPAAERAEQAQERGFFSLLFLVQALGAQGAGEPLRVAVVTDSGHEVTGDERVRLEGAPLLGLAKVIPLEHPAATCRCVDVLLPTDRGAPLGRAADLLLAELTSGAAEPVVAYRGTHRWEQLFEPVRPAQPAASVLRDRGVYLITGGLGSIGMLLARHLAETVQARLVLTGRSAFPAEAEWDTWQATRTPDDPTGERIRQLREIQALGGEVLVARADVSDRTQMQAVLAAAERRFGPLNGVFHAAGTGVQKIDQVVSFIQGTDRASCARHFDPKLRGLLVLEELLRGRDIDFCHLFSSLSSVLGGVGFAAYAASNMFMDAFVQQRRQDSAFPWLSINWDTWQTSEAGLPAEEAEIGIAPEEGRQIFPYLLAPGAAGQLVVSTGDLNTRMAQLSAAAPARVSARAASAGGYHPRPNLRSSYIAPRNALERKLGEIWQRVLSIERVGIQDNFFDLGGDSLIGLKLIKELKHEFGIDIPAVDLYKGPTISRLADIINQMSGEAPRDDSARQAGQSRGAARRERRLQQKRTEDTVGGQA